MLAQNSGIRQLSQTTEEETYSPIQKRYNYNYKKHYTALLYML